MRRAPVPPPDWRSALRLYIDHGWTYGQIARLYRCHYGTVSKNLRALGVKRRTSPAWHSERGRLIYEAWRAMRQRCTNPKHPSYTYYGGRGLRITPMWDEFEAFHDWALSSGYRIGRSLALIDPGRDYSPTNCRWIGARERKLRKRELKPVSATTARIAAFGEVRTIAEWAQDPRCKVTKHSLRTRFLEGIAPEEAITSPRRVRGDPPLPKARRPVIARHAATRVDWKRVLALYGRGLSRGDIAARMGVPYSTIQWGLREKLGPLAKSRRMTPARNRLYHAWQSLWRRTTNPDDVLYPVNGAIGVRVCRDWREFEPFFDWAMRTGGAEAGLCLARVRRRGPYSPGNCEWVTLAEMNARRARGLGARKTPRS